MKTKTMQRYYKLNIKTDKCKSCQLCIFYCPTKHLELSDQLNKKGVKFVKVNNNKCIGCGFCFLICPDACIEILEETSHYRVGNAKEKFGCHTRKCVEDR